MAGKKRGHPNWPYAQRLLEALSIKEAEARKFDADAVSMKIEKIDEVRKAFWKGYGTGMGEAKEVVREFGKPTEEVLG